MIEIRQGDVYWFDFGPASGAGPAEVRPCVVVQSDTFNRSKISTTVVCLITSNLTRGEAPGNVALPKGTAGLPKASVINVSQVMTVDKDELRDRSGRIPARTLDAVLAGLALLFSRDSRRAPDG